MATIKEHSFDQAVAKRITDYCKKNNISMVKLAREAGITNNQIYFLTTSRARITLEMYVNICKALKEPITYFLKEEI